MKAYFLIFHKFRKIYYEGGITQEVKYFSYCLHQQSKCFQTILWNYWNKIIVQSPCRSCPWTLCSLRPLSVQPNDVCVYHSCHCTFIPFKRYKKLPFMKGMKGIFKGIFISQLKNIVFSFLNIMIRYYKYPLIFFYFSLLKLYIFLASF